MFDEGRLLGEIAEVVGYTESRMTQILQEEGRSAWKRRYPQAEQWDLDAIFADYANRVPLAQILAKYEISNTTFHRLRRERGVPLRPRLGSPGKTNYQYKHGNGSQKEKRIPELTKQVAAICLGYIVPRGWQIHHLDGDPSNNRPENLAIFHNKSEHANFHQLELRLQREGAEVDASQLVSETGGFLLPIPSHPIVSPHEKDRLDPRVSRTTPKTTRKASSREKDSNVPQ